MTGRCQRYGGTCNGPLCRPCQAIIAGLQAEEQDPRRLDAQREVGAKEHGRKPQQRGSASTKKLKRPPGRQCSSRPGKLGLSNWTDCR